MTVIPAANTLIVQGLMNEEATPEMFEDALEQLRMNGIRGPVLLDFSQCPGANSLGIVTFLRFFRNTNTQFCYIGTPPWLVGHFSLITQFLDNQSFVKTIQVPYIEV